MTEIDTLKDWLATGGLYALRLLLKAVLAIILFLIISKVLKILCKALKKNLERFHMEPSASAFVVSLMKYVVLGFAAVTLIVWLGIVKESAITAVLASAGVAISLALQGGLSNFAGGILILLLKPFRAGDYIICPSESVEGSVKKIEMYYTTIMSIDNRVILIPNANLTNNTITNVTAMNKRKLEIKVGVSYHSDILKAKLLLKELVETDSRFHEEDRQFFVDGLEQSQVLVGFRAWVATEDYVQIRWDTLERLKLKFDEEHISIPYPQLDVHIQEQKNWEKAAEQEK